MDTYEKKLALAKEALDSGSYDKETIEYIFPELKESEDERIRKKIIATIHLYYGEPLEDEAKEMIAWLEKQGTPAKLSEEEQNRFAKGVLSSCAMSFVDYLDAHKYEGKMCVSNGECEDIENAFHNAMWDRLHRYYCKYIEKQDEQKPADSYCQENCNGFKETGKCFADGECKAKREAEQNYAWNEEDEINLGKAIWYAENPAPMVANDSMLVEWLKNLRGRVQPQKEWSETEEIMLGNILAIIKVQSKESKENKELLYSFLQSLKPQNQKQWKPSEGQLECLGYAIEKAEKDWSPLTNNRIYLTLKALKEQLEKL